MNSKVDTQYGEIKIDRDVIAQYAGNVAVDTFGIVGMAIVSVKDGIIKLLKRDKLMNGVEVIIDKHNEIILNFHIIVSYRVNIPTVCTNLQENVKFKVEKFCNIKIKRINVFIDGIRCID